MLPNFNYSDNFKFSHLRPTKRDVYLVVVDNKSKYRYLRSHSYFMSSWDTPKLYFYYKFTNLYSRNKLSHLLKSKNCTQWSSKAVFDKISTKKMLLLRINIQLANYVYINSSWNIVMSVFCMMFTCHCMKNNPCV